MGAPRGRRAGGHGAWATIPFLPVKGHCVFSTRLMYAALLGLLNASPLYAQGPATVTNAPSSPDCAHKPWFVGMPVPYSSAQVLADGRITFRLCAPEARQVAVTSSDAGAAIPMSFAPNGPKGLELTREANGLWSGTTAIPLAPGTYRYSFRVDGLKVADPLSDRWSETRNGIESVVQVEGPAATFQSWDAATPHGAVTAVTYWSKSVNAPRRMHIYTPPGYMKNAGRYPVLYLVHGAGDSDDSWTSVGQAHVILDRLIASGRARPMIVVMPAGHTPDRPNVPMTANHDFGRDLVEDVIPYVDHEYRTIANADARAMAGLSMGGSHTLREGLIRPDTFHWIGVFSMGLGIGTSLAIDQGQVDAYAHDHAAALTQAARSMHLVYYAMGREDFLYASAAPTRRVLDSFHIAHTYHESDGGHTWLNWRDYLADFAPRLFRAKAVPRQ